MSTIAIPTNVVQSAIKAKCPVTGIPIPGHAPFRVLRSRLRDSLKGLKVISATYDTADYKKWLIVEAVGERIRATRKFYPMGRAEAGKLLDKWLKSERRKGTKAQRQAKKSAEEKRLTTLQDKLAKLTRKPQNPCLVTGYVAPDYERTKHLRWRQQKELRRSYRNKSDFAMAVLTGRIDAELSNPATHYYRYDAPVWGPHRYASYLNEERQFVKSKIAVLNSRING